MKRLPRIPGWSIVLCAALVYPLAQLAGGSPRFPNRHECIRPPVGAGEVEAVFGRFPDRGRAEALLQRATTLGFRELELRRDACGDVKVLLREVPSLAVGQELANEAARVGIHVTLERPGP
jgi:hypothetical protein